MKRVLPPEGVIAANVNGQEIKTSGAVVVDDYAAAVLVESHGFTIIADTPEDPKPVPARPKIGLKG